MERGLVDVWLVGSRTDETRDLLRRNKNLFVDQGPQNHARLSWYISQADALVLPSVEDGFGLVQAQAMACGVPVIATTNTGAEDLFTDGVEGFIVPIRDVAALRERIEILMDDESRTKYPVMTDEKNNPVAPKHGGVNEYIYLGPHQTLKTWAKFAAPPAETKTISVYIPRVEPFENVPIMK